MDTVITRLSEIEEAAVKISEDAVLRKKELDREYEEKTRAFDEDIDRRTKERLKNLREELQKKADQELARLRTETEAYLNSMEMEYEKDHEKISRRLLERMTGE